MLREFVYSITVGGVACLDVCFSIGCFGCRIHKGCYDGRIFDSSHLVMSERNNSRLCDFRGASIRPFGKDDMPLEFLSYVSIRIKSSIWRNPFGDHQCTLR